MAVRRFSNFTTLMNPKGGSSGSPSLATVAFAEEGEDVEASTEAGDLETTGKEETSEFHEHDEEKMDEEAQSRAIKGKKQSTVRRSNLNLRSSTPQTGETLEGEGVKPPFEDRRFER